MPIYAFASANLTNIWAGIGAGYWAVSKSDNRASHMGRVTKAANMKIGSFGIIYCSKTKSLTVPFVVLSNPDSFEELTDKIWPGTWVLPFKIHPLGTPLRQLSSVEAMKTLPTLRASNRSNFGHALPVQATTVFAQSPLGDADWAVLIARLADSGANA